MRRRRGKGILLIGDYPPPMGGIAVHVQQLHQAFTRAGLQCRVLDIGKRGRADPGVINGRGYKRYLSELFRYAAEGWLLHLHTSGNNPKAWTVAASVSMAGQVFRVPSVITVHSGLVPQLFPNRPGLRRHAHLALAGYRHVVTVSEAVKETLLELGVRPSRISMYPAFCASEVAAGEAPAMLAAVRERRRPLISCAHNASPVYGRKLIFEAVARLRERHPGIGLAMFGPATGAKEFKEDVERFGVGGIVEDFGELDNKAALAVIAKSDVFVRPTTADGDSVSVREALTLRVPVVATNVALRPQGTVVCKAGDAADLAEKIDQAIAVRPEPSPQPDCVAYLRRLYSELNGPGKKRARKTPVVMPEVA